MANVFKSAQAADVGTSYSTVYTVPSATTTVILGMSLCNKTGATVKIDVLLKKAGTTDYQMLNQVEIPTGVTLEVLSGQKYIMQATDVIQVKSDALTSVDVVMGIMEIS